MNWHYIPCTYQGRLAWQEVVYLTYHHLPEPETRMNHKMNQKLETSIDEMSIMNNLLQNVK